MCPVLHLQSVASPLPDAELVCTGQSEHTAILVAPVLVEYLPLPHDVHAAVPLVVLYLPTTHATQGPPFGPVYPMMHMQAVCALLDEIELL